MRSLQGMSAVHPRPRAALVLAPGCGLVHFQGLSSCHSALTPSPETGCGGSFLTGAELRIPRRTVPRAASSHSRLLCRGNLGGSPLFHGLRFAICSVMCRLIGGRGARADEEGT